ncbi:hypothetical protein CDV31_002635 [Fusarium ambrosium]|uniref:Heterokaryon incompatibility domain-containing protein n=1 Tax=Fusarium ambrosium TaxID=131363 RepID=A0A428UW24_9HYPO|nr:hypothetical protein CDV31_002635 [Fusarium ambrosium]
MTTRDNLRRHLEGGIDLGNLPKTFQDAIKIARELKVRYLWIDALCIIQNEDDHEDWKRECGNMASIYRNSYLTVAATWANSATGGCFITPDPGVVTGPIMMRKVSHFPFIPTLENLEDFPILTRAWTYQERLLAPRVIYFGHQEILWDCLERHTCECGGATIPEQGVARRGFHGQTAVNDSAAGPIWIGASDGA